MTSKDLSLPYIPQLRREIAQIGAHASLQMLNQHSTARWTYSRERVVRNLTAAGHALFDQIHDSEDLDSEKNCSRNTRSPRDGIS